MLTQFSRSELLLGPESTEILRKKYIAIFGIGGVGSYLAEALARSGIGHFILFDPDKVCITNINRQLIANHKTIGKYKVEVMKERILDINPDADVVTYKCFYSSSNVDEYDFSEYSYILDCIDTISSKLLIIEQAKKNHIPILSCMGTGNKLDPTKLLLSDINKTSVCPLARVMRQELKKRNITKVNVLFSREPPIRLKLTEERRGSADTLFPRPVPGSVSFVPSAAGLIIAAEVVKELLGISS